MDAHPEGAPRPIEPTPPEAPHVVSVHPEIHRVIDGAILAGPEFAHVRMLQYRESMTDAEIAEIARVDWDAHTELGSRGALLSWEFRLTWEQTAELHALVGGWWREYAAAHADAS